GLRHRLFGNGGPGTWYVSGGFGLAMIVDKSPCEYNNAYPCGSSATSCGPTVSAGLEYRFDARGGRQRRAVDRRGPVRAYERHEESDSLDRLRRPGVRSGRAAVERG